VSLAKVLFVVFLVLKLTGAISWSWWWVVSPLLAELALGFLALAFLLIVSLIVED
jgi:hypothetical protein